MKNHILGATHKSIFYKGRQNWRRFWNLLTKIITQNNQYKIRTFRRKTIPPVASIHFACKFIKFVWDI